MSARAPLVELQKQIRGCRSCADAGCEIHGAPVFSGTADARMVLVGQSPGPSEAARGRPFCGPSGDRLFAWLGKAGFSELDVRERHYMTSVTRCYPGRAASGRGDRVPSRAERDACRAHLTAELAALAPEVVVPIGRLAIDVFCGSRPLNAAVGSLERNADARWIVPLPHPSGASRWLNTPENTAHLDRAIRHLARLKRRLGL